MFRIAIVAQHQRVRSEKRILGFGLFGGVSERVALARSASSTRRCNSSRNALGSTKWTIATVLS